jgi:hypothetical protein
MMQKIWSFSVTIQLQVVVFLWRWWSARNKINAGERMVTCPEFCSLVTFYMADFTKKETNKSMMRPTPKQMETTSRRYV